LKILHISPSYYPAFKFGGPINSVHLLNKFLVKKGLEVDVITTNAGLSGQLISKYEWEIIDGVRVKYHGYYGYERYNFSLSLLRELKKNIKNYDLVHITAVWNFPVFAGAFMCNRYKIPYIISPHGALMINAFKNKSEAVKKLYYSIIASRYINNAKAIHFTTQYEREESTDHLKSDWNSFVIPNGLQLDEFEKETNQHNKFGFKNYILFTGRIHNIKGLDILFNAVKEILNENLLLVLAGPDNNNYKNTLIKLAVELGISNYIKFLGELDRSELNNLYKRSTLFVLPSYSENFGMSVIEAMACETPVVISDKVGIYKEVEEAKAGIIVKTEIDSLHNGMKKLIEDAKLRKTIAKNGRKLVEEKYDIEKVADQMIEAYRVILKDYKK